jgi:formiminoglutamase
MYWPSRVSGVSKLNLGERVQVIADHKKLEASLQGSNASFVLLGVPEDIGVKANMGVGGTDSAWIVFPQRIPQYSEQ